MVVRLTCQVGGTVTESHGMAVRGKTTWEKKKKGHTLLTSQADHEKSTIYYLEVNHSQIIR